MKRILTEFEFSDEQLNIVRGLARSCGLCEETVKILYGRGVRDAKSINAFIHPSKAHFVSPFKMSGMRAAVELITLARDEEWSVVVYGDYDADGICAATIMGNALRDFGIQPVICVPERSNGYGLSTALIDMIFDEYFPQLFITVDCGISCAEEVDYIKEQGAEVIVTDHHELPSRLPDCIKINPKFKDDYIYDNLCGAGVAFKVACALNGEAAYKYLDFAAIATVADSVPLTGENRDIVYEGLKIINKNPSACYAQFLGKQESVSSQSLAFSVAPRINAAGRMGDAKSALALFNETDAAKIFELSAKLSEYNLERQKYCDELYTSAKKMIFERGGLDRIILLYNENWNSGFIGIVAARLADEFSRPVILFVKNGDMLKGSARSVEGINIFNALKACSEYISEFGGHSQAAGVNVKCESFENLSRALENYLTERYSAEDFVPTVYINGKLDGEASQKFVKELELLEPFGVGNRRPVFVAEERALATRKVKDAHLSFKCSQTELMFFNGVRYKRLIESGAPKKFIFDFNVSNFHGKEYIKGFVRDVIYDDTAYEHAAEDIAAGCLQTLSQPKTNVQTQTVALGEVEELMLGKQEGVIFLAWDSKTISRIKSAEELLKDLFLPSCKSNACSILFAPLQEADLSGYTRVILLDNPDAACRINGLNALRVEILNGASRPEILDKLDCGRDELLKIFALVSANQVNFEGSCAYEVAISNAFKNKLQSLFALEVFEQLKLISFESGKLKVNRGVKSKLENSELYNIVKGGRLN